MGLQATANAVMTVATAQAALPRPILRLLRGQLRVAGYFTSLGDHGTTNVSAGKGKGKVKAAPVVPVQLFRLSFDYQGVVVHHDDPSETTPFPRHAEAERAANKRLDALGAFGVEKMSLFSIPAEHSGDRYLRPSALKSDYDLDAYLDGQRFMEFSVSALPKLRAEGWLIEIDADYPYVAPDDDVMFWGEVGDGRRIDWFAFSAGVEFEGTRINLIPMLLRLIKAMPKAMANAASTDRAVHAVDAFLARQSLAHTLSDGRILCLPKHRVAPIMKGLMELVGPGELPVPTPDVVEFNSSAAPQLSVLTDPVLPLDIEWKTEAAPRLRDVAERMRGYNAMPSVLPSPIFTGTLRPYQQAGLDWFAFLSAAGFGGVLADDMGLGKTVQTLSFIASEKHAKRMTDPVLIVAPTSVLPNWEAEAARFTPTLKVLTLRAADRAERLATMADYDIVLTTYPLLARDKAALLDQQFYATFLDEAQAIKNPASGIAKAVHVLRSTHRFALTGTPLENNLSEVWSLFHYLNPGMLGDQATFTRQFRTPIEKHGDVQAQQFLSRKLKPFMLRRTKDLVAKDLPPKTEVIESIELDGAQRDLYELVRLSMHDSVRKAIAQKGMNESRIMILDALLKLRQICCDPRLLKLETAKKTNSSVKLERLMELLTDMVAGNRRVLLFSQFTSMLALIEQELVKRKIPYVIITGEKEDRRTPVEQFQTGKVPLFLISLKAGGTGLNLTAADTVIHYDPWWNPAVELQATDRAHRLGQTKPVFVHKLIVKSTVEEGIQELCKRKAALAAALFSEDGAGGDFKLTEADVDALFQVAS
jgi:superfamily II DNA or RNA helicase